MTDFVSTWNNDLLTVPFAPLGLIAMPGCEELGQKVNNWLMKWYEQQEALERKGFRAVGPERKAQKPEQDAAEMEKAVETYYQFLCYDRHGKPTPECAQLLGIEWALTGGEPQ